MSQEQYRSSLMAVALNAALGSLVMAFMDMDCVALVAHASDATDEIPTSTLCSLGVERHCCWWAGILVPNKQSSMSYGLPEKPLFLSSSSRRFVIFSMRSCKRYSLGSLFQERRSIVVTENTYHSIGIHNLNPEIRLVIDVGGRDSKAIYIGA